MYTTRNIKVQPIDRDVHIIPLDDLRVHEEIRTCWCVPTFLNEPDSELVVVHHSLDGRELIGPHGVN